MKVLKKLQKSDQSGRASPQINYARLAEKRISTWSESQCNNFYAVKLVTCTCILGYYLYTEASGKKRNPGEMAILRMTLNAKTPKCLSFWYHMNGYNMGILQIRVNDEVKWMRGGKMNYCCNFILDYSCFPLLCNAISFFVDINVLQKSVHLYTKKRIYVCFHDYNPLTIDHVALLRVRNCRKMKL